ncbi:MAG: hypothetical protein PVH35_09985 [Syntrophobacterales bacterium]|jgi:hypothetical protein
MKGTRIYSLVVILLYVFVLVLAGCSGSSSDGGGSATVNGKVADGYLSGADVYAYSDADMTNQIGAGSTDSEGNFSMILSVSSVPDPVYLKSVGGIDVATGMPAPTMLFVASGSSNKFNISPITDSLYKYSLTLGIDGARQHLTGQLGITNTELYDDPVVNTDLDGALNSVLSSGTMDGTLADGDYIVHAMFFVGNQITAEPAEMNVTISNGVVNGTEVGSSSVVTGKVQGSSIVLTIVDDPVPANVSQLARMAGDIGLMGSVTGVFTYLDIAAGGTDLYTGMCVANFVPVNGLDPTAVENVISNIYAGPKHIILRDIFGPEYKLGWGDLTIKDVDFGTNTVTASDATIWFDNGSCDAPACDPTQVTLTFNLGSSEILETSGGDRTNLILLAFDFPAPSTDMLFLLQPVGNRRGIFLVVDVGFNILAIGDSYMATGTGLAPSLDSTTDYEVEVAVAHAGMLEQLRSDWIGTGVNMMPYSDSFTTPDMSGGTDFDLSGDLLKVFNGSIIAFKNDADNGPLNDTSDFIRLVELYETGAIQGEDILGGPLSFYPATFVGFVKKQGETAPSVAGTRNFLARTLYSKEVLVDNEDNAYRTSYITGDLTISGSSATLNWTEGGGTSGTASLTVENTDGLYHMHGTLDSSTYIDIFWPLGGKKSVYITSDNGTGDWLITEAGEAYLTH